MSWKSWLRALKGTSVRRPIRRRRERSVKPSLELLESRIVPSGPPTDNIQAFVYVDEHGTGIPTLDDPRVPGVNITLNVNGTDVLTRATDSNGRSWFGPGWGNGASIKITMTPTAQTGDGTPYHYWNNAFSPDYVSTSANTFTFVNNETLRENFIPQDFGIAAFDSDTFLDGAEGFYFGIKSQDHLVVTAQPISSVLNGSQFDVKVTAEDANNNTDQNFTGSVAIALGNNPGNSTLGGTLTVQAQNGVADFGDLTLNHAGKGYTLNATSGSLSPATTNPFDVKDQLVVTTQPPSSVAAGKQFDVKISAEDVNNNVDSAFSGSVDLAFANDPNGNSTLGGTHPRNAANGVADFSDLTVDKPGQGFTLQATSSGQDSATTNPFDVKDQLVVTTQPPHEVLDDNAFDVQVSAEDANGNVDKNFTGKVTIALASNPGGSVLGGTLTLGAVAGVVDFSTLTLDQSGQGYTLQASGDTGSTATTNAFDAASITADSLNSTLSATSL
jgi:hypothetical protein